jgi:hypothetical protein
MTAGHRTRVEEENARLRHDVVDLRADVDRLAAGLSVDTIEMERLQHENVSLQAALVSRVIIEQAKGIIAERNNVDPETAFLILRRYARTRNLRLHAVCAAAVASAAETAGAPPWGVTA